MKRTENPHNFIEISKTGCAGTKLERDSYNSNNS